MNILDNFTVERLNEIISNSDSSEAKKEEVKELAKFALEAKLYGWVTTDGKEVIEFWHDALNK